MSANQYTIADLMKIIATNPDGAVRVIAAELLYKMGERDQLAESVKKQGAAWSLDNAPSWLKDSAS